MVELREYTGQKLWFHNVLINILEYVATILEDNDFPYWLYAGTLLGAVRNGKMIPWDPDIDIGVFSRDAEDIINKFSELEINQDIVTDNRFSIGVDRGEEGARIIRIFCSEHTDLMTEEQKVWVTKSKPETWSSYYNLFGIHVDLITWGINVKEKQACTVCSGIRWPLFIVSEFDKILFEGKVYSCPRLPETACILTYNDKNCITDINSYPTDVSWIKILDPDNSDILKEMEYYKHE